MFAIFKNIILTHHAVIANMATVAGVMFAFIGIIIASIEYLNNKKAKQEAEKPFVFIDLDTSEFNICSLVLKNIGNSPAKDIHIKFDPNIELRQNQNINDIGIFNHLSFLSPNRDISFFFGTFLEDKVKQKFDISIEYKDLKGNLYKESQIIDPSEYLGLSHVNKKDINDVAKYLEDIKRSMKSISDTNKKLLESWKNGLLVRNLNLTNLSLNEKLNLLSNLIKLGNDEDKLLNPFIYDLKALIKETRDSLLSRKKLTQNDKDILDNLNVVLKYVMILGHNPKFDSALENLNKLISTKEQ